jgi:hypothetical protein
MHDPAMLKVTGKNRQAGFVPAWSGVEERDPDVVDEGGASKPRLNNFPVLRILCIHDQSSARNFAMTSTVNLLSNIKLNCR